jgi:hypothetical protein
MLPKALHPFIEQRPICVMARAVLEQLYEPKRLDALFQAAAQKQYTRSLLFSTIVELLTAVVLCVDPSVYAAYRNRRHKIPVSDEALYKKLQGMELGVSAALVRDSAEQAAALIDQLGA